MMAFMERNIERSTWIKTSTLPDGAFGAWDRAPAYEWRNDVAGDSQPDEQWWLVPTSRRPTPVRPRRGLTFLETFAALDRTQGDAQRQAIRNYADRIGSLGEMRTVTTRRGERAIGEAWLWWRSNIDAVSTMVDLLDGLRRPAALGAETPVPPLLREAVAVGADGSSVTIRLALNHDHSIELRDGVAQSYLGGPQAASAVQRVVRHGMKVYLTRRLSERISVAVGDDPPSIAYFPATLLSALHLELVRRVVGAGATAAQRQCPQCAEWFQPRRRNQIYCSAAHQQLWNYHHDDRKRRRKR
jgi:hypothetical protein